MPKQYWLIKSEPDAYSIDQLKKDKQACWDGVRNYQARNFMRDTMKVGDGILYYHSNAKPPGVVGLATVASEAYMDHTAWNKKSKYFDPKARKDDTVWMMVDVAFDEKFPQMVSLDELKDNPKLKDMLVIRKGQRLSIQPVSAAHFKEVVRMARRKTRTAS